MTLADKMKMLGIDHDESKNENRSESTQILSMKQNATGDGGMQNTTQYRLNNKQNLTYLSACVKWTVCGSWTERMAERLRFYRSLSRF